MRLRIRPATIAHMRRATGIAGSLALWLIFAGGPAACSSDDSHESAWTCVDLSGRGCYCSENPAGGATVTTCDTPAYPPWATCCLSESECGCYGTHCRTTADGCQCDAFSEGTDKYCNGPICCNAVADDPLGNGCRCGSSPCPAGWEQVSGCSVSMVLCPVGQTSVWDCKAKE